MWFITNWVTCITIFMNVNGYIGNSKFINDFELALSLPNITTSQIMGIQFCANITIKELIKM